jgi:hypothetical protein
VLETMSELWTETEKAERLKKEAEEKAQKDAERAKIATCSWRWLKPKEPNEK